MFYRYTTALVLMAVVAGACSQSRNESVVPEAAVSSTVDAAVSTTAEFTLPSAVATVPATTVPDVAAPPVVSAVPEVEVPPSTASSSTALAATISTVPHEVILPEGVPMFAPDLTVEAAELVGVAVEACRGAAVDPFGSGCVGAVWEVCYGVRSDIEKIRMAMGDRWDALGSEQNSYYSSAFYYIRDTICGEAFTAEIVELGSVLVAKYGDRYYREINSIRGEQGWVNDYQSGSAIRFTGDLRDFADFRHFIDRKKWLFNDRKILGLEEFDLSEDISAAAYDRIVPLLEVLSTSVNSYSLDFAFEPPAGFDADEVLKSVSEKEKVIESLEISIAVSPNGPDDIKNLCNSAIYAARINRKNWQNYVDNCTIAAEGCVETYGDGDELCDEISRLAREAGLERMWQLLPAVCASSEDIVYYNPDDTCRRAAFDAYVYSGSSLKRGSVFADAEGINIREAVFYLSQPLLLYNLPQHQRTNDARYIEEY